MLPVLLLISISHLSFAANCDDTCPPVNGKEMKTWKRKMRVKALRKLDHFLDWSLSRDLRSFSLSTPPQEIVIAIDLPEVAEFEHDYGYFSETRPIVGSVTKDVFDLELTCCLLKTLYEKKPQTAYLEIAVAEVLSKVLAYRDLKAGQKIRIPITSNKIVSYEPFHVDQVFDIWLGMPAFGLVPEKEGLASILLFRGTDLTLTSLRGWASLMSDLDITGPGLSVFQRARDDIALWLKKMMGLGKSARVIGFSLGGTLAAYTFIYENAFLSPQGSIAVCAPGVADKVLEDWQKLAPGRKAGFTSYINSGDVIPKVGNQFGTIYRLSPPTLYGPMAAHTMLMCSKPLFTRALINPK